MQPAQCESNKKLSCRKETVRLLRGSVLAKYNWKTIFCGHYRSIFNHYNAISPKSIEFDEITQNKGYYTVQDHPRSPMSVPIESPYDFLLVINTTWHYLVPFRSYRWVLFKFWTFCIFEVLGGTCMVHIGSLERAYSGLPINDNWTFFARCYGWALRANIDWKSAFLKRVG